MSASHIRNNSGRRRFVSQKPPLSIVAGLILRDKKKTAPVPVRPASGGTFPERNGVRQLCVETCKTRMIDFSSLGQFVSKLRSAFFTAATVIVQIHELAAPRARASVQTLLIYSVWKTRGKFNFHVDPVQDYSRPLRADNKNQTKSSPPTVKLAEGDGGSGTKINKMQNRTPLIGYGFYFNSVVMYLLLGTVTVECAFLNLINSVCSLKFLLESQSGTVGMREIINSECDNACSLVAVKRRFVAERVKFIGLLVSRDFFPIFD
jgi:hypothetical protein